MGYMLAGETGARLTNLIFTYVMAYQGYQIATWLGGNPKSSKFAALLFLSTPLAFTESSSLLVEAIWGTYIVAGIVATLRLFKAGARNADSNLKVSGLMLGFAAATKAITLSILPAPALLAGLFAHRWYGPSHYTAAFYYPDVVFLCWLDSVHHRLADLRQPCISVF